LGFRGAWGRRIFYLYEFFQGPTALGQAWKRKKQNRLIVSFQATIGSFGLSCFPFEIKAFSLIEFNLRDVEIAKNE
jgi:hypothetical protein